MYSGHDLSYDSSSESDRGWRRRPRPGAGSAPPPPPVVDKKKKRKKSAPQLSINRTWARFSQKKFSTALTVLPFAPVAPPTSPERGNELLNAGYDRAVEECKRKVEKIIRECKRVNMRYRDPGWDLDWDFKMEKGHCLNSLGVAKFDVKIATLVNPNVIAPRAVKRVHEIFDKPTFMKNMSGSDVKQGGLGDCWLMASLSGLANVPGALQRSCVAYDTKIGIYGFVFYRDGEWIYSIIDDKLYLRSPCWDSPSLQRDLLQQIDREDVERVYRQTYQTGSKALFFAQNKDQNETWVPLLEKAYAKAHGDYACLSGGWIGEGLEDLSGGVTTELLASDILDTESFWEKEISKVNEEFLFGCSTGLLDGGYGDRDGISEGHAYNIMETRTLKNGTRLIKLRNPWGKVKKGNWEGAWSDGSKEWTTEVQDELGHTFGSDSVFWISYEDLLRKYQHFDRTRLFRDPDWRCCQRWVGVEVPWKAVYNEKFHIKLTKDSPMVLVLSQLDGRYFKGLHGQYNFGLHFRIHEQGQLDAEDYIVRSHGNYLMDRSVSIEVPNMAAGNYSVFISVSAERDTEASSVEDMIKKECKKRVENEKLAQVGQAYDLAHSKAVAHLDELAKIRKTTQQKTASDTRKKERRLAWEKKRLTRSIQQRQLDKNAEKAKKKHTATEEERKKAEEAGAKGQKQMQDAEVKGQGKKEATDQKEPKKETMESKQPAENEDNKPKDKAVQTDAETPKSQEDKSVQADIPPDNDGSEPISASSSSTGTPQDTPQQTPLDTPRSETQPILATNEKPVAKVPVPPVQAKAAVSGGPPPPPAPAGSTQEQQQQDDSETAYSSDSPVEDWEEMFSSDNMTHNWRVPAQPMPLPITLIRDDDDTDDEDRPQPWNAICVVGFRVYSKDEGLELRVLMEGGSLSEGGMGEKGAQDLDNAQVNAGGARVEKKEEKEDEKAKEGGDEKAEPGDEKKPDSDDKSEEKTEAVRESEAARYAEDGLAPYQTIIRKNDEEFEKASAPVESSTAEETATITVKDESKAETPDSKQSETSAESQSTGEDSNTDDALKADDDVMDTSLNWG